ncbi:hypothetical protein EVAR_32363_1 [Eumeta japonica]|uniref:Uncharacterized protein n=1 Tax=Eumeta variegata TaxID=151549 RepID=A0A4C1VKN4_EUMVA|nr:hypothetical protein EVAR_32363_1 [Eumeta japonica]
MWVPTRILVFEDLNFAPKHRPLESARPLSVKLALCRRESRPTSLLGCGWRHFSAAREDPAKVKGHNRVLEPVPTGPRLRDPSHTRRPDATPTDRQIDTAQPDKAGIHDTPEISCCVVVCDAGRRLFKRRVADLDYCSALRRLSVVGDVKFGRLRDKYAVYLLSHCKLSQNTNVKQQLPLFVSSSE